MFIREQEAAHKELRADFQHFPEFVEAAVWSPVACRHTAWLYEPLCKSDERGRPVPGSRRRNPFHPYR